MDSVPILLVTANVGSIFDDPTDLLKIWIAEFLSKISNMDVKFIAVHCQEVGGKKYEKSMKHVDSFVKTLLNSNELKSFNKVCVFLDEDFSSVQHFTALGSLYFVHETVDASIWNFKESKFVPLAEKQVYSGNIEAVPIKEKAKFPQHFFPECKWSRKGYMRTRWSIFGTIFDLINIHLFHDASNLVAMTTYPSVYSKNRKYALEHTLQRFHNDQYENVPYFVFGDFNFRTDTKGVINKLTDGLIKSRIQNTKNNDQTKLQYTNEENVILSIGKKEFSHSDHENMFLDYNWLRSFDKEIDAFKDILAEFPLVFAPSYPFEEQVSKANSYMPTRCPAWCDRVLLSHSAKEIIKVDHPVEYGLLGPNTCMGDHKPVYLKLKLAKDAGIVRCCGDSAPPLLRLPSDNKCRCFCRTLVTVPINIIDTSDDYLTEKSFPEVATTNSKYLQPSARVQTTLEPYTPESSASRSPFSEENDSEEPEVQRRTSFCPAQLKNKLENILLSSDGDSNNSSLARRSVIVDESTDRIGDSSNVRSRANSTKTRTLGSNIEYKRFNFIRFKKKSRKKNISCIEAVCAIA